MVYLRKIQYLKIQPGFYHMNTLKEKKNPNKKNWTLIDTEKAVDKI